MKKMYNLTWIQENKIKMQWDIVSLPSNWQKFEMILLNDGYVLEEIQTLPEKI